MADGEQTRSGKEDVDPALLDALGTAFRASALPGEDENFDDDACRAAAEFVLRTAAGRQSGEPALAMDGLTGPEGLRLMRLAIVNDDMPFLVDSVANAIAEQGIAIYRLIHPVLTVERGKSGKLEAIRAERGGPDRSESFIYIEIERVDAKQRRALEAKLRDVLRDVRGGVEDWLKLQVAMGEDADALPDGDGSALLRWFLDRNLTLVAHEHIARDGTRSDRLGIARVDDEQILSDEARDRAFKWFDEGKGLPLLMKSNRVSTVHRSVLLDLVLTPLRDGDKITGLSLHAGLWTSAALATPPNRIPVLRAHLASLMDKFGFDPSGHAGKSLSHALTSLPHDLLITFALSDLERIVLTNMSLSDRPRPKLLTTRSPLGRHLFVFVWLPRDDVSTSMRVSIEEMLKRSADGTLLSWSISLEDGQVALLRFTLNLADRNAVIDDDALDDKLKRMVRGWQPAVESALAEMIDEKRAAALSLRYADNFGATYRSAYNPHEAAADILRLHALDDDNRRGARLYRLEGDRDHQLRLKLYHLGGALPLSDAVPVLEDFGFVVLGEIPSPLGDGDFAFIHDFLLGVRDAGKAEALVERAETIERAITAEIDGSVENDPFNSLIISAALEPEAVVWLRAWFRYLRQTGMSYSMQTVIDSLSRAPGIARQLIHLFRVRHDPAFTGDREAESEAASEAIDELLLNVAAIDEDRILRTLRAVALAVLRTNAFAPSAAEALGFKIDSHAIPGLPAPVPWREIFVYSPRVEGIHLRAGPIARGGIRWSDRRDDFRTEILGLMKAQRVKNAVIVPTGAKGGFFPKRLPNPAEDRDAWIAEGTECYKSFIRTLLSVTDNIVDDKVVHPENVVIRDGEDPYFVVAADKGTASFSDTANAIAIEHGFWLGDAFASGGSNGYDHKAMGITAKGAWISVQRHFAEMGVDVQEETVRVCGVGDMSGDVFGNGMLLSKAILLVAAFDHRHIFLDPDPDPGKSWEERKRLFDLPRSSWDDYDKKLISRGGGVFARLDKSIKLSKPVREMLAIESDTVDPATLMSAILRMKADLLWFGGIGTYVKARVESSIDVGDPANDPIRVDAEELGVRVIGEGANLAVTQAGRIAFDLKGGRINADFIDNSAGVDCSDKEVNIKIALNPELRAGTLKDDKRNALLKSMTDAVAEIVLEDNRHQALGISIAENDGTEGLPSYVRLIETFEGDGKLDRIVEGLPGNEELLRRGQDQEGMTRPELAVLLATGKLALQDSIESTLKLDDPSLDDELLTAFPEKMRAPHRKAILEHRLRGEIIATRIANRMVNRLNIIYPFELAEEEGCSPGDVANAFIVVERLFGLQDIWNELDFAEMDETTRLNLFDLAALAARSHIADLLRTDHAAKPIGEIVSELSDGVGKLTVDVDELLSERACDLARRQTEQMVEQGAPTELAEKVTHLYKADGAIGIADLAQQRDIAVRDVGAAFIKIGDMLGLGWAQTTANRMVPADPWERLLAAGLARDFQQMRLDFLRRARSKDLAQFVDNWAHGREDRIEQFRSLMERAQKQAVASVPMLAQIAGQARVLLGR
ncbi:NAD-glutamate dehydrogenase [Novosphingopyxis sp.]|uniref:NAD-glutamate dehydrogenase n=1 Tax=Novosphingopyxis sp. TaxID=2709690 RepID=UPI003B5A04C5